LLRLLTARVPTLRVVRVLATLVRLHARCSCRLICGRTQWGISRRVVQ
jgi:hypothetical protein